jgi:outer membrane protein assembly factor BamB
MRIYGGLIWVGAFLAAAAASAADWTDFRGPGGQGHAEVKGLPVEWSPTKNVAWKRAVPGLGWSSPVIANGQVIVTSAVPVGGDSKDLSLRALAYDAKTGEPTWDVELFLQKGETAPKIHGKNSHASPTAVVHGERIYVHFGHQGTACVDLSGKVLWRNQDLSYPPVHGNGGTPALVNDLLVYSADGANDPFVAALEQASGQLRWKSLRVSDAPKKFSFSTPLVISVDGQPQVISPGSNSVGAFDPRTGEEIWRVRYQGYSVIPRPIYAGGLLFIGTGYDSPSVIAIRPGGKGDVTDERLVWTVKKGAPHTPRCWWWTTCCSWSRIAESRRAWRRRREKKSGKSESAATFPRRLCMPRARSICKAKRAIRRSCAPLALTKWWRRAVWASEPWRRTASWIKPSSCAPNRICIEFSNRRRSFLPAARASLAQLAGRLITS